MTIRAVLFDFAGVLTSSPWAALAEAGGGDLELIIGTYEDDTDHPWHQVERGEMTILDWMTAVKELGEARGVEVDFTPLRALLGDMTVHDPIVDHVRALRKQGYKLALVTNNVREGSAAWRSLVPVDELFDVVVDSAHVGVRKPDPRIFRLALERLGNVAPEQAVFLDDFQGNVAAAERLGMRGILVEADHRPAMAALRALLV